MPTCKRRLISLSMGILFFLIPQAGFSSEQAVDEKPWEKFGLNLGVFISSMDSSFHIGSGVGLEIDVENFLDLDSTFTVFRTDAIWRITKNRRHRLEFTWFSLKRDGDRILSEDVTIGDGDDQIVIPAGTGVEASFDLDIYELAYNYSFFQDDRVDLAAGIGLYIMPIDFGLRAAGIIYNEEGSESFTAPLPALGLHMDIALTPQWFIRSGSQIFYIEYDHFRGAVLEFRAAVEYNPWKHVGIGLGFDALKVEMEANGEDWPSVDFKGKVEFSYTGLQLYLRYFF